jgi:hypothetical protein
VAPGQNGVFVDGGVSPHNNPSLILLLLATLKGYGFRWPMGSDRLLLVSVGTGSPFRKPLWSSFSTMPALMLAAESLRSVMQDSNWLAQTMLQWMSDSPTPWRIDSEVGDLAGDHLTAEPLLSYLRYDAPLNADWLSEKLRVELRPGEPEALIPLDRPHGVARLLEIGRIAAEVLIQPGHLSRQFDEVG